MSEWNRSTKECTLDSLQTDVKSVIQKHLETYNLGSILSDPLICIETISVKKSKNFLGMGGPKQVIVDVILTPHWLVWVVVDEKSKTALSAMLRDLTVKDYKDTIGYSLLQDSGIEVTGIFTGRVGENGSLTVSMFIGLGDEPPATNFKELLFRSVQAVKQK